MTISKQYQSSYAYDMLMALKLLALAEQGDPVYQTTIKVAVRPHEAASAMDRLYSESYVIQQVHPELGIISCPNSNNYIKYYSSNTSLDLTIYGSTEFVEEQVEFIKENFTLVGSYIKWFYTEKDWIKTPLDMDSLPIDSMYPFLGEETLHEYYQRFLDSTASIILLIGPPGTGKTSFIKGLLAYANTSATVTYDPAILNQDAMFVDFIKDNDCSCLVLEDSDAFLSARTDGNTMMHRFLNVSNGLVSSKGKKLIFSTNLPSIRDVDPALIRPGRCFDVVKFDHLTTEQAEVVAGDLGLELNPDPTKYTLADIFHQANIAPSQSVRPSFGFNQG